MALVDGPKDKAPTRWRISILIGLPIGIAFGACCSQAVLHDMSGSDGINFGPAILALGLGCALTVFRRSRWLGVGLLIGSAPSTSELISLAISIAHWASG